MYDRKLLTRPLTREDAEVLQGSVFDEAGRALSVEEILALPNVSKVTHARDICTGEMKPADEKHNRTGVPFFVFKTGS